MDDNIKLIISEIKPQSVNQSKEMKVISEIKLQSVDQSKEMKVIRKQDIIYRQGPKRMGLVFT